MTSKIVRDNNVARTAGRELENSFSAAVTIPAGPVESAPLCGRVGISVPAQLHATSAATACPNITTRSPLAVVFQVGPHPIPKNCEPVHSCQRETLIGPAQVSRAVYQSRISGLQKTVKQPFTVPADPRHNFLLKFPNSAAPLLRIDPRRIEYRG
jgi:hypothetical protein